MNHSQTLISESTLKDWHRNMRSEYMYCMYHIVTEWVANQRCEVFIQVVSKSVCMFLKQFLIITISSTYCSLSHNNISDGGTYVLAWALQINESLHELQ